MGGRLRSTIQIRSQPGSKQRLEWRPKVDIINGVMKQPTFSHPQGSQHPSSAQAVGLWAPLRKASGFTLIELMIAIAIIGILATIALPSYNSYVQRSNRVDAQTALLELAQALERSFTLNNTYCTSVTAGSCTISLDSTVTSRVSARYTISNPTQASGTATATSYVLRAVPVAGSAQASDRCGTLELTSTGSRTASVAGCWN